MNMNTAKRRRETTMIMSINGFSLYLSLFLKGKKSLYKIHNECISLSSCLLLRSISVTTYNDCT